MATLRNKRKLAAVSRETPESTRSGKAPSVLDPELTQEYISQVSEEIEGRVTKKLSKEFSRTQSRILGALSKLDEFLLNPQVRTCSVVAPGSSRSNNLENQGTNEDRPSDDPGPEVEFASPISGAETNPHSNLKFFVKSTVVTFTKQYILSRKLSYRQRRANYISLCVPQVCQARVLFPPRIRNSPHPRKRRSSPSGATDCLSSSS